MLKAVIFDFDGVLADNTSVIIEIFQETARRTGLRIPAGKEVIAALGLIEKEMFEKLFGNYEKYQQILTDVWMEKQKEAKLMPETKKVLQSLKTKKAIVTSAPDEFVRDSLGSFVTYFDAIITQESTEKHKPYPEPLLLACKKLKIKPAEAVYIGDRIIDFETARNAGMDFIGMLSGGTSKGEFKKAGVKKIISSLSELLNIVGP